MALLFATGFDHYNDRSDLLADGRWQLISSSITFSTGRSGSGQCLRVGLGHQWDTAGIANLGVGDTFVFGMAMKWDYAVASNVLWVRFGTGTASETMSWVLTTSGLITVRRHDNVNLGTTSVACMETTWNYIEMKVYLDTTSGTVDMYKNNENVLSLTGVNTYGGYDFTQINFEAISVNYTYFDDIYLLDTTGSRLNDRLGDVDIKALTATSDAGPNNWSRSSGTANYEMVDEAATDDDTTYVYASTVGDKDMWGFDDVGATDTIEAVQVISKISKEDAGDRTLTHVVSAVGSTSVSAATITIAGASGTYAWRHSIFETADGGGRAWNASAVNSGEFGVKVQS